MPCWAALFWLDPVPVSRVRLPDDQLESRPDLVDGTNLDVRKAEWQGNLTHHVLGDVGRHLGGLLGP